MSTYGFICNGCHTPIGGDYHKGGEKCIIKFIVLGEEFEILEGYYDGYGGVFEELNDPASEKHFKRLSNEERAELGLIPETYENERRFVDGKPMTKGMFMFNRVDLVKTKYIVDKVKKRDTSHHKTREELTEEAEKEWLTLPEVPPTPPTGREAWHHKCYQEASQEMKKKHIISEGDLDYEGCGPVRKEYQ